MNPVCSYKINYPSDLYTVQCTITWISSSVKLNTIHMCVLLCCILHYTYVCSCAGFYTAHLCALVPDLHYTYVWSCARFYTAHVLIYRIVHMCVCICFRKDIDVPLPSLQSFPEFCKWWLCTFLPQFLNL